MIKFQQEEVFVYFHEDKNLIQLGSSNLYVTLKVAEKLQTVLNKAIVYDEKPLITIPSELNILNSDIVRCARCNGNHKDVLFMSFKQFPIEDGNGLTYTHYGVCPTTNEPMLMRAVQKK